MTDHDQPAPPPPPPPPMTPMAPPPPITAPLGAPVPKERNTGLLVGLGIVLIGVIVGVVIFVSGGDDKSSSSGRSGDGAQKPAATVAPDAPGTTEVDTTEVESTDAPDTTAADEAVDRITDDTGTFSIPGVGDLPYTTQSFEDENGLTVASIIVAEDLEAYGTTLEGNGITILAVPASSYTANEMMNELVNGASCMASAYYESQVATQFGSAFVSRFDDCGDTGTAAQVVLTIEDPASGLVFGVYVQGVGSSQDDLLPVAENVINSIVLV